MPVVVVDAVAVPDGWGLRACFIYGRGEGRRDMCSWVGGKVAYVPVKDVEAVDCHRLESELFCSR